MLYGDICVYYLILMIFVFVDVCVCVCMCVYFNSSYLRNESTDFRRVKLILFVSRENKSNGFEILLIFFCFITKKRFWILNFFNFFISYSHYYII